MKEDPKASRQQNADDGIPPFTVVVGTKGSCQNFLLIRNFRLDCPTRGHLRHFAQVVHIIHFKLIAS